jgi:rRNA small subunit pseudouridine methyltransferase Nep1
MEQLFSEGIIPPESDSPLITLTTKTMKELMKQINPSHTIALSSHGTPSNLELLCERLSTQSNLAVLIGAFPHGKMKKETLSHADEIVSIHPTSLEAWVVTSRLIYKYEKVLKR